MKQIRKTLTCHLAIALVAAGAAVTAQAATPTLKGRIVPRPLTPGDKTVYGLPASMEVSGGLDTVAVGTPVYLEAEINIQIPATNITGVTWSLTNDAHSTVTLTSSPLGANVPVYEPSDRLGYQVADRRLLRADIPGQYGVLATITTANYGTTNVVLLLNVGTYMGVDTCANCHSGGTRAPDMYHPWTATAHSKIFTEGIDGLLGHYSLSCLQCHTVGYDTNTNAVNGGFDDVATAYGWTFPPVQTNGNWDAMPGALQNVANIQCENCHGPGSQHALSALKYPNTVDSNWPRLEVTTASGDCNQCHDAPTHHIKGTEWYVSRHALTTGPTSPNCVGCHSANGFIARMNGDTWTNQSFAPLACQTCHEPHGVTTPTNNVHLLRVLGPVTMPDGSVVTNAGNGAICLQCHQVRNGSVTNMLVNYPLGKATWYGGSSFGAHDNPQGDMVLGINAVTYGQDIPSSAHRAAVSDLCVGCHMTPEATTDPSFLKSGGHTFTMSYAVVTNGLTNTVDRTDACVQCHGPITTFDLPRGDFNGDGVIQGVQTEIQSLLDKLSTMLPNSTYQPSGNYVADGLVKTSVSFKTNWPTKFLQAGYNWQFVNNDGSKGVHNAPFAAGILKASIANLTGDSNSDGLPDAWQIQYYGSATNVMAAPNYMSAAGVPNWLAYTLGVNPLVPGQTFTNGIVYGNVVAIGDTNTVHIYTAAEVVFDTVVGSTYQVQSISSLSDGWQNVGAPIAGTGASISYLAPTRQNVQQYYRVMHNP